MPKRSVNWNETLAEKLKDMEFSRHFLLSLIEEGVSLQEALGKTIRGYGVKEFSTLVNLEPSAIQRAIDSMHNPTKDTLEKILSPFGLELGVREPKDDGAA